MSNEEPSGWRAALNKTSDAATSLRDDERFSGAKEMLGQGTQRVAHTYGSARNAVTQEEAWAEVDETLAALVDVVRTQHALLAALTERVAALEVHVKGSA